MLCPRVTPGDPNPMASTDFETLTRGESAAQGRTVQGTVVGVARERVRREQCSRVQGGSRASIDVSSSHFAPKVHSPLYVIYKKLRQAKASMRRKSQNRSMVSQAVG
jgi:hypothetical protein